MTFLQMPPSYVPIDGPLTYPYMYNLATFSLFFLLVFTRLSIRLSPRDATAKALSLIWWISEDLT